MLSFQNGVTWQFTFFYYLLASVLICMYIFIKTQLFSIILIIIFYLFWHLYQIHTFNNNLNDEEMITTHLMCNKYQKNLGKTCCRSSHPEVLCKKGVLRNLAKFIGKHLCQSLFFNKVAGSGLQLYWKRDFSTSVFLWILRNF